MAVAFVGKIADMVKSVSELAQSVVEQGDSKKYADSVETLNQGVGSTYEQMRLLIVNSETLSDTEKLERLRELAELERESKGQCGKEIQENREHVGKIALEVTKGVLTCGLSFAPSIVKEVKQLGDKNITPELLDSSANSAALPCEIIDTEE